MKVLLISNLYGANARGGAERVVAEESRALTSAGREVVVAALASDAVRQEEGDGAIRIVRLPSENLFHYLDLSRHGVAARLFWHGVDMLNSRSARAIAALVAMERPDVVHTHNLMGLGFLIPAALRREKVRHVHTIHDVQLLHPSGLLAHGVLSPAARIHAACMRQLMGSPAVVIFPSAFLKSLHDRHGFFPRSKKIVLQNPAPPVAPASREYPGARFLFVGQLEAHKGVRTLLDAWKAADLQNAELVIAGTGSHEDELRTMKDLRGVTFVGKLDAAQVRAEMSRAAWTIVPSVVIENAPAVIAESLSAGTPVIASAIGGIPEFVKEGRTGKLVRPGDVEALAAALRAVPEGKTWTDLSDSCRRASEAHGLTAHVTALAEVYREGK